MNTFACRFEKPVAISSDKAKAEFESVFSGAQANALDPNQREVVAAAMQLSPYLHVCAKKEPKFLAEAFSEGFSEAFNKLLSHTGSAGQQAGSEAEMMEILRIAKRRAALLCAVADLSGEWQDLVVTRALSDFARATLRAAFDFILLQNHNGGKIELSDINSPQTDCGLVVLALGKFGADELNYSSDIDLIVFHEDRPGMKLLSDDPITLLNRMAKQLIKIMQERTGDGYVFRTDLRLRPDPASTPLVIPVEAALNYYEGQGQNWERAAMIKASPVAGDIASADAFLEELTPFIWRKYLDFAAIQDVHSIKRQIHAHKGHGEIKVLGHNIKLGRGGIREIEFFAQTQQLIAGGRNPDLREKQTIRALEALAGMGWIEASTTDDLTRAYWFLRNLEHRLQMIDDAQTHILPEDKKDFKQLAALCGYRDDTKFSRAIEAVFRRVEQHYAGLFETAPELSSVGGNLVFTGGSDDPGTVETLKNMGFRQPVEIIKTVRNWHVAKLPALQASAAREMLTELVPDLLKAFSAASDPDSVLYTFDRFISGLPAGIQLFAILKSNPKLNELLVRILIGAPALAEQISRKPHVFDSMLEPQYEGDIPSRASLKETLSASLSRAHSYEMKLDAARRFFMEVRFQISCRFFASSLDHYETAVALSNLAEVLISQMLETVQDEFASIHGHVPGAQTCILAMGRLGSRELTAGSDLDLIFLYDFDSSIIQSDGEKPLDPTLYYVRLIKRFITAMSAPTAEGSLYQLDFRLRPSGNAGPLATQVDGFLKYQQEEAWIWEAQSLTRARAVAGDRELMERVENSIPEILALRAGEADLKAEIFKMRMLIEKEKGTDLVWDMKNGKGGLLDIEFVAQWLVLACGKAEAPPIGTSAILETLGSIILEPDEQVHLLTAFKTQCRILHLQRVCIGEFQGDEKIPDGFKPVLCSALELPDIASCESLLQDQKKTTRQIFNRLLGQGA